MDGIWQVGVKTLGSGAFGGQSESFRLTPLPYIIKLQASSMMRRIHLNQRSVPIGVSVPKHLIPLIEELAASQGRTRSGLIRFLLLNALQEHWNHNQPLPKILTKK